MLRPLLVVGVALVAAGCSSSGTTTAIPAGSPAVVTASPAGPTSDLCQAITYAAPAASQLLRGRRPFAGAQILPGTPLPGTTGVMRCLGSNSSVGVTADACVTRLIGVDVTVYDGQPLPPTPPLAQAVVAGGYHVQLNLGGFQTRQGDTLLDGTDAACAPDAALASQILTDVLRYYRP